MFFYLLCDRGFSCLYGGRTNRCLISWALCDNSGNTLGQHKAPRHTSHICIWHFALRPLLNTRGISVSSDCGQASAYYDLYQVFQCWQKIGLVSLQAWMVVAHAQPVPASL